MLALLLLLAASQTPAFPGEGSLVSICKQGRLAACQELAKLYPEKAAQVQAELAKATLSHEALKIAEEEAREKEDAKNDEAAEASGEPPNCKGQEHHIISRPIAEALEKHKTLRGIYRPRDERFKTRATDKDSHCGYQDWHRKVDAEVIDWLEKYPNASPKQFMEMLREIYRRPELLRRFPNGF
jgi:hypothetical protein